MQSRELFVGEGPIHRSVKANDLVSRFSDSVATLYDNWNVAVSRSSTRQCMGSRKFLPDGKRGDYEFKTYSEVNDRVVHLASGLVRLGLKEHDRVGAYSVNNEEWVVTELACYRQNFCIVSIYDTLGADAAKYVVNHADVKVVVCQRDKLKNSLEVAGDCPTLKTVVLMGTPSDEDLSAAKTAGVQLLSFAEVEAKGREEVARPCSPQPGDLCTIMYTSGTTGDPKGVMLTHANVVAAIAGALRGGLDLRETDVHFSYLPLAHIFERVVLSAIWSASGCCCFFQGTVLKIAEDLAAVRPTVFISVPRLFNRFHEKILAGVKTAGRIRQMLFRSAFNAKLAAIRAGSDTPFWNRLVLNKIRNRIIGDRVRLVVSGSAPLSGEVQDFLRVIFGCPVMQGYGLTETSAASCLASPSDVNSMHVGPPLPSVEIKLVDVPEMEYLSSNVPQRGEVVIRGPTVFSGYYRNDEETKKVLMPDGWFQTGDVGQWNADGTLSIIDRKKNIFKLAQGEYIAAEKLEAVFGQSTYVAQCFIYGNSLQSTIVAVVVPDYEQLLPYADETLGMKGSAQDLGFLQKVCSAPQVNKLILEDLKRVGKENQLRGFEFVQAIVVEAELWSVENNLLTPSFKNKRPALVKKYKDACERLYDQIAAAEKGR